jgi:hypothetical protein
MTIDEFDENISGMAMARMDSERYCGYLRHETREDKYLREEYLAIQAVAHHKAYPGDATIELGDEKEQWDARIAGTDLFEVVQALPANEHVIRKSVAGGEARVVAPVSDPGPGEPAELPITGPLARFLIQAEHAHDHLQFPRVIVEAIEKKHGKRYADERTLVVVFDGDYSFEEDRIVHGWVEEIRRQTHRGAFREVLLVELARRKVFPVF